MHPTLARYMSLPYALDALSKAGDAEHALFVRAAKSLPEEAAVVKASTPTKRPSAEVERALIQLAARAALYAVEADEEMAPVLSSARRCLLTEGATEGEAEELLALVVLEEGFGYDTPVDEFDRALFLETLRTVPKLAALTQERVEELERACVPHQEAARALFEAAWSDGAGPISPEHVEEAAVSLADSGSNIDEALEGLTHAVAAVAQQGLVGPIRRGHLDNTIAELESELKTAQS